MRNEFKIQSEQYAFPYHWLPEFSKSQFIGWGRTLDWGLEYWAYTETCRALLSDLRFGSLLDVGCGDGRFLNYVMHHGIRGRLVGIDLDERAIQFAKAFNHENGLTFECRDIRAVKECFDAATLIEVMEHIPGPSLSGFFLNINHLLNPGGFLVVSVPHRNVPVSRKHYQHYDSPSLIEIMRAAGFSVEKMIFVHKRSKLLSALRRILCNKWYCSNSAFANDLLGQVYKNLFLICKEDRCSHICILARKA